MTSKILALSIGLLSWSNGLTAQTPTEKPKETPTELQSNVHIGFVYPLSTNGTRAAQYSNLFSAHALIGISKNERAFCASGFGSVVRDTAQGFLASGFFNVVGGSASGAQLAGFINAVHHKASCFQGAGFINVAGSSSGAQAAGFANISAGDANGLQVAGFINQAKSTHAQIAGFINVADSVSGPQIAGFINIASKVKGPQISGFINIADSSDYPIGLINIIKKGQKAIGVTVDESGTTLAAFRSGGKYLYGIIGAGFNAKTTAGLFAMQAGMGFHVPLNKHIAIGGEVTSTSLTDFWWRGSYWSSAVRIIPSVKIGRVETFAGPSINYASSTYGLGRGLLNNTLWSESYRHRNYDLYLGFLVGVQYHL